MFYKFHKNLVVSLVKQHLLSSCAELEPKFGVLCCILARGAPGTWIN